MKIQGNKIVLTEKECEAVKKVYREIPGDTLHDADRRAIAISKVVKWEK